MKIAIVGSSGFIGRMLVKECVQEGHEVTCIDLYPPKNVESYLNNEHVSFVQSDSNIEDLCKLFIEKDAVVCLAAIRPLKEFGFNEYTANIKIATNVMEACLSVGLKNAVFMSSRSVYSDNNLPWKESEKNIALNLYGEAKAAVDNLILFMNKKYGTKFKSLRLAQVLGLGEVKGYLINTLIDNAYTKKTSIIYGTGCGKKQLIYVKDVINAILKACKDKEVDGIFNIGVKDSISIVDLASLIYRVFNNEGNYILKPELPEDKKNYLMSTEKANTILGFEPKFTIEEAVIDIRKELENESK